MPTVPQRQQSVQDAALPGVRVVGAPSASTYGADLGGTLQRAGAALYERELMHQDQAAVLDAETKAGTDQLRIMQGMRDFRGKDAIQAEDYAMTEFDKSFATIRQGLSSDRQRNAFDRMMQPRREGIQRAALNHYNTENERFLEDTFNANMKQSVDFARANADYPMQIANEKNSQEQKVRERGERLGQDEDTIKAGITAAHSATNSAVIHGLLANGQDLRAKAYYDAMKKDEAGGRLQFTAEQREGVEKALGEGSTRGEAHRATLKILAETGMETAQQRRIALNTADAMEDPKVGELVRQKLEHRFAEEDKRKHEDYQATFTNATKLIDEQWKQNPTKAARELIPSEDWAKLSIGERHTLDTYLAHFRDPGKKVTDLKTWVNFNSLKDEDLAAMSQSDIMKVMNRLSESDQDKALTRWNGVINKKEGKQPDKKYEKLLTNSQYLDNALENSGHFQMDKPKKDWNDQDKMLWNDIQNEAGQALSELEEGAKPKEVQERIQAIVDKHLGQKFKYDKGFFSFEKDVPAGLVGRAMKEGGTLRIPLTEIPEAQQAQIKGLILDAPGKKSVSTDKIEQIYAVKKRIDLTKAEKKQLIEQIIGGE